MRRDTLLAVVFVGVFAGVTAGLAAGGPLVDLDLAVREWSQAHRPTAAETVARVVNPFGQGGALLGLSIGLAGLSGLVRWWRAAGWWWTVAPLLYVVAAVVLLVPTVLVVKHLTDRGAPSSPLPPEQTVALMGPQPPGEYDLGYPGGHAVNTVVWYGVLLVLVTGLLREFGKAGPPRTLRIAIRVAAPVLVVAASTYLSFHWLTDGLAGLALGLAFDRVLALLRWLQA